LNAPVYDLPAGEISVAGGVEYRLDQVDFPIDPTDPYSLQSNPDRTVRSVFAEVQVPIFSEKNALPGLYEFNVNVAGRVDDHNDFGTARTPRFGALYRPVKWLAFRGS